MLESHELSVGFAGSSLILAGVSLQIPQGQCIALLGRNGSGKTTLAQAFMRIIPGIVRGVVDGKCLLEGKEYDFPTAVNHIGYTMQDPDAQLVSYAINAYQIEQFNSKESTCNGFLSKEPHRLDDLAVEFLSGGERQRLVLETVLRRNQRYLILDEPTAQLDPGGRSLVCKILRKLCIEGVGVLVLTHDPYVLRQLADKCYEIKNQHLAEVSLNQGQSVLDIETCSNDKGMKSAICDQGTPVACMRDVSFAYGRRFGFALTDMNFALYPGEIVGLVGKNGCGKTTLMKLLAGILKPNQGKITWGNRLKKNSSSLHPATVLFQNPNDQLFADTVKAELLFGPRHLGIPSCAQLCRYEWASAFFNLPPEGEDPFRLSMGQKKILCAASVAILDSNLYVLDEPDMSLDSHYRDTIAKWVQDTAHNKGHCFVIISHNIPFVSSLCDRLILLDQGKVALDGPVSEVRSIAEKMLTEDAEC
jgi:energy-coupling factor transport system ATP-binding protein